MTLQSLDTALKTVLSDVFHFEAFQKPDKYIVWAEDGEANSTHGDNRKQIQVMTGTVDYFTKTEFDPNVQKIQKAMSDVEIPWRLNSVQYEEETGYVHHEWVFEIPVDPHG